ncbi:MAG TPA: hypothetical protein PLD10_07155 [Rhodopila sp.]|nr:hypothetical protein [Rhodopila sp.]
MDYGRLQFPPYVFVEFPKWITVNGSPILVNSAQEEASKLAEAVQSEVVTDTPQERAALEAVVARRGRPPKAKP